MSKRILITEDQVKQALQIDDFRHLSKQKVMEFVSLIPQMDQKVAESIINQFPDYKDLSLQMVDQLNGLCDKVIQDNARSGEDAVASYKLVLEVIRDQLQQGDLTFEQKQELTQQMILIADKVAEKDTENKQFLGNILKGMRAFGTFALALGAAVLGVKATGGIPRLHDDDTPKDDQDDRAHSRA